MSADPRTDDALVAATAAGDERAFRVLVERHGPMIRAFARRLAGPGGDADDYVQEAFSRLWRDAGRWRAEGVKVSTWLARVVTNLAADAGRRAKVRKQVALDDAPDMADTVPDAEAGLVSAERKRALEAAIAGLPERQRAAIQLTYGSGLANAEVADALGTTIEAVEAALTRGRAALKAAMRSRGLIEETTR